jgi:ribose 5-phosphate isomerase B
MKIAIGSDHAGFELKEEIKAFLEDKGHQVHDYGTHSEDRADYPDYGHQVAKAVASKDAERGVLVCGSAIGMCMVANRHKGVRAAVLRDDFDAEMSRKHNDANVACVGGRVSDEMVACQLIEKFMTTEFEGGRHENRVKKIDE